MGRMRCDAMQYSEQQGGVQLGMQTESGAALWGQAQATTESRLQGKLQGKRELGRDEINAFRGGGAGPGVQEGRTGARDVFEKGRQLRPLGVL